MTILRSAGPTRASAIAREQGVHLTTALYHLRRLAREGVVAETHGQWYVRGRMICRIEAPLGGSMSRALSILRDEGPLDHSSLASRLGVTKPAITALVKRMSERGLVRVECQQRRKLVHTRPPSSMVGAT